MNRTVIESKIDIAIEDNNYDLARTVFNHFR